MTIVTTQSAILGALFTLIFYFVLGTASLVVGKLTNKGASYTLACFDLQGGTQLILTPVARSALIARLPRTTAEAIIRQRIMPGSLSPRSLP